jgi:HprK-related kinase B
MELETIGTRLMGGATLCPDTLTLHLHGCNISVRSNSAELVKQLRHYFGHVSGDSCPVDMEVIAIESAEPQLGLEFTDWKREPGKTGRKDSYHELTDGRLVRKVRTGMVFLQSEQLRIAAGPCIANDNQVINFINAQYMNWLQHRGWLICHAAGLVRNGQALAIAGFSGGGKSTLMLHLLAQGHRLAQGSMQYLTNDRLFIKGSGAQVTAAGIPKLPRVNPGTIVHNPALHGLISPQQRQQFLALPGDELWHLEQKYDVYIDSVFGEDRIARSASLGTVLILNWSRDASESMQVQTIDLSRRRELLSAIMKSPGPFYQYPDGTFLQDTTPADESPYLEALDGVQVVEATGRIDFAALSTFCIDKLLVAPA